MTPTPQGETLEIAPFARYQKQPGKAGAIRIFRFA